MNGPINYSQLAQLINAFFLYAITLPLRLAHLLWSSLTIGPSLELLLLSLQVHVAGVVGGAAHQTLKPLVPLGLVGDVLLLVREERERWTHRWGGIGFRRGVTLFSVFLQYVT